MRARAVCWVSNMAVPVAALVVTTRRRRMRPHRAISKTARADDLKMDIRAVIPIAGMIAGSTDLVAAIAIGTVEETAAVTGTAGGMAIGMADMAAATDTDMDTDDANSSR